jgi:hypothetical protein
MTSLNAPAPIPPKHKGLGAPELPTVASLVFNPAAQAVIDLRNHLNILDQDDFVAKAFACATALANEGLEAPELPTVAPNPQGMDLVAHYYFPINWFNPQAPAVVDFKKSLENFIKNLLDQPLTLKDL